MGAMQHHETIIVGGGPAGATCAGALVRADKDVLILDHAEFPRDKLCAGWVTQKALDDLQIAPADYPHGILKLSIRSHLPGVPFAISYVPMPGDNYSIRRVEFDAWLLQRSGAPVARHRVREITRTDTGFEIDGQFTCTNLVGAGGTTCPVFRTQFDQPRRRGKQIVTLEREFDYPARADQCRLYFFRRGLIGYAWYVPKPDGKVNIGIGGKASWFRKQDKTIHDHLKLFLGDLNRQGLLDAATVAGFKAKGHPYYLYGGTRKLRAPGIWLIGDSGGLASVDLGEGIGPAIESGLMAAAEIAGGPAYAPETVTQYSTNGLVQKIAARFFGGPRKAA